MGSGCAESGGRRAEGGRRTEWKLERAEEANNFAQQLTQWFGKNEEEKHELNNINRQVLSPCPSSHAFVCLALPPPSRSLSLSRAHDGHIRDSAMLRYGDKKGGVSEIRTRDDRDPRRKFDDGQFRFDIHIHIYICE